jgi:ABC-2 type transport system ATP-binding protein
MGILEVRNLRKAYGDLVAVEDVSFTVDHGQVFGLLGPNGAGKSTTMMMVCGLLTPDAGTILIDGEEMRPERRELKRMLGVVPQDLAIYPELTARENLRFFGKLYGLNGSRLNSRVDDALSRTGLTPRADDPAQEFSGGMKRRLNFGCALLHEPRLLILDEPTVGVDPQSRSHLLESVQQVAREGVAVIYASHYMEEVEEICRKVAIVDHGRVVAEDSLDALLGRMKSIIRLHIRGSEIPIPPRIASVVAVERNGDDNHQVIDIDRGRLSPEITLDQTLADLLCDARSQGATLETIESHEANLERLFLELTGNKLRD